MDVFDLAARITLDDVEYLKKLRESEDAANGFGSKVGSALGTVGKVATAAFTAASGAAVAFAKSSVSAGMQFDTSMSQVAATMGKTMDELNSEVNTVNLSTGEFSGTLRDFARYMGSTTAFSASQAADALNYMALAGYDAKTSMEMLPNVLNLAAAGGMELASASDMITDASSALGLSLDETSELVDQMAMAASKSNTSVAQLGEAILTVGGTAKGLAGGTAELTAVLGILADNGVKGAEGGTALRNMISSLSSPTKDATIMLEQLGVSLYDDEGNIRGLNEVFGDLGTSMKGLSRQAQDNIFTSLFNARDLKSARALVAGATIEIENMSDVVAASGVVWDKYAESGTTAEGVLTQTAYMMAEMGLSAEEAAKHIAEEFGLSTEDAIKSAMAFQDVATTTSLRFEELVSNIQGASGFTLDLEGLREAAGTIGYISESADMMKEGFAELGVTAEEFDNALKNSNYSADKFLESILAAADAGVTMDDIFEYTIGDIQEMTTLFQNMKPAAQAMADTQLDNLAGDITKFNSALGDAQIIVSDGLTPSLRDFVQFGTEGISQLTAAFKEGGLSGAADALGSVLSDAIALIIEKLPDVMESGVKIITALLDGLKNNAGKIATAAKDILLAIADGIMVNLPTLVKTAAQIIVELAKGISQSLPTLIPTIVQVVMEICDILIENLPLLLDAANELIVGLTDGLLEAIPEMLERLPEIITSITDFFVNSIPQITETGVRLLTSLVDNLPTIMDAIVAAIPKIIDGIINAVIGAIPQIVDSGVKLLTSLIDALPKIITTICDKIPEIISGIVDAIMGNLDKIIQCGIDLIGQLLQNAPQIIAQIILKIPEIISGIVKGFADNISKIWDIGKNLVEGIWHGIENAAGWLWDKIKGWANNLVDTVKGWFGIHSPSTVFAGIGDFLAQGLGVGFEDGMDDVEKDMRAAIPTSFDTEITPNISTTMGDYDTDYSVTAGEYSVGGTEKQPLVVIFQMPTGAEIGRQYIADINEAYRLDGVAY